MDAAVGSAAKAAPRRTSSKVGGLVDEAGLGYVPSGHHGDVKRQPGALSFQASAYCAKIPPSTVRIAPVVHAASSDARWSTAIVFVSIATPAFATAYGWTGNARAAFRPRTEPMLTIEPPPWRCM